MQSPRSDEREYLGMDGAGDPGVVIVLNGASSSGKTTIARALQRRWRRPLQISGIDTFLACQSEAFFGVDGRAAPGFSWSPTVAVGQPAYAIEAGALGTAVVHGAHRYWQACGRGGLDQVIDHVLLERGWADDLARALAGLPCVWVAVRCPVDILEQRERDRGDRIVGQARGHAHTVHRWRSYDVDVDTSVLGVDEAASAILDAVVARTGVPIGADGLWPAQGEG